MTKLNEVQLQRSDEDYYFTDENGHEWGFICINAAHELFNVTCQNVKVTFYDERVDGSIKIEQSDRHCICGLEFKIEDKQLGWNYIFHQLRIITENLPNTFFITIECSF